MTAAPTTPDNTGVTPDIRMLVELFWKFHNDRLDDPSINEMKPYIEPILAWADERLRKAYEKGYADGAVQVINHVTTKGD